MKLWRFIKYLTGRAMPAIKLLTAAIVFIVTTIALTWYDLWWYVLGVAVLLVLLLCLAGMWYDFQDEEKYRDPK